MESVLPIVKGVQLPNWLRYRLQIESEGDRIESKS
jgi:hypothetical protein